MKCARYGLERIGSYRNGAGVASITCFTTGASGYKDTTVATSALFNGPGGMAIDGSGNLYVSDYNNNAIRKITPAGAVSTFYMQSGMGPAGLCFDGSGNLVVTAQTLRAILKITPGGLVSTIAGGSWGYTNGTGSAAQFENPADAQLDPSGNIIVADYLNNAIRKITPAGVVTTLAGSTISGNTGSYLDGVGTAARFNNPTGVAITQGGVIYVADFVNQGIRRIMPDGTVTLIAGSPTQAVGNTDAVGTAATFNNPLSIYVDNTGTAYVADLWASVRKLMLTGYTLKGTLPAGLAFDPTTGIISGTPTGTITTVTDTITAYNASGYSTAMVTFTPGGPPASVPIISYTGSTALTAGTAFTISPSNSGGAVPATTYGQVTTFAGSTTQSSGYTNATGTAALFNQPKRMVMDGSGNIYLADGGNNAIRKITPGGVVTTFAGSLTGASGYKDTTAATSALFNNPGGMAIDGSGNLYVSDYNNNAIRKITPAGAVSTFYSQSGMGPSGLCFDSSGNLIVTAQTLRAILRITPGGLVSTIASGSWGYTNGTGAAAQFENPADAQLDPSGNIIVADYLNNAIRKITPAGVVTTLAGSTVSGNTGAYLDGVGTAARFNNPTGVAITQGGVIYVADFVNQGIRRIMPDGTVTLIAGSPTQVYGNTDGTGAAATFHSPVSIYVDNTATAYVADMWASVRKLVLTGYTLKGTLPAGLAFDPTTGTISGTPTGTITTVTDTITAYNASGYSTAYITFGTGIVTPSPDQNYIITYAPTVSGKTTAAAVVAASGDKTQVRTNIQYFDGLGRPSQTVQVKGTPGGMDLVQPVAYDQFGREAVKYLPYAASTNDGSYKTDALAAGAGLFKFYNPSGSTTITQQSNGIVNTSYPYASTGFEPSPLSRLVEQGAPGADWQMPGTGDANSTGHTVRTVYQLNNYLPLSDTANSTLALIYTATVNSDQSRILFNNNGASYQANLLSVTVSRDENWKSGRGGTTEVYKDNQGRVILKRTFNYTGGTLQILSTYYVYDDFGNLAFVLPPLANADNGIPSQTVLDNLCYQYRYDENGRLTQKKIPGKDWECTVYNQLNQPVLTQDGNQRVNNQWTVTKYDALGRVIMTGLWNAGSAIPTATLQASVYAGAQWDARDYTNNTTGYNITSYPAISTTLAINYYDDYAIPSVPSDFPATGSAPGQLTGSKVAVLNTITNTTPDMLLSVHYYDILGRIMLIYKQHYLGGVVSPYNYDATRTTYNFNNEITTTNRLHYTKNSANTAAVLGLTVWNRYIYDHVGRKIKTWEQLQNGSQTADAKTLVSQIDYNEIGQMLTKRLHSTDSISFLQNIAYNYNERGWLLSALSSGNTFNFNLYYNTPDISIGKQYNGNIAEMRYSKTGVGNVTFQYAYDQLNRLNSAVSTGNMLNETISYDMNGNIMSLARTGSNAANLNYSYYNTNQSNQLQTVTNGGAAFRSYSYDPNGNATSDGGNKIIEYNLLDLPHTVRQSSTTLATYTYDAAGEKLRNTGSDGSWDYIDGIVYQNGAISYLQTEEGRASLQGGVYHYEYNLKDHLGNVRYSFDKDPTSATARRIQEDEYYSFGLRETPILYDYSNNNRYLYNGKEIQTDLTSQYYYGARFYDPVIARWTTIDPLAESNKKWSPYTYGNANPIRNIDIDGMLTYDWQSGTYFDDNGKPVSTQDALEQLQEMGTTVYKAPADNNPSTNNPPTSDANTSGMNVNVLNDPIAAQNDGGGEKQDGGDNNKDGSKGNGGKSGSHEPKKVPPEYKKKGLPGFPGSTRAKYKNGARETWLLPKGKHAEWDSENGKVEVYDKNGNHLGEFDPETGERTKDAVPGRQPTYKIEASDPPGTKMNPTVKKSLTVGAIFTIAIGVLFNAITGGHGSGGE